MKVLTFFILWKTKGQLFIEYPCHFRVNTNDQKLEMSSF